MTTLLITIICSINNPQYCEESILHTWQAPTNDPIEHLIDTMSCESVSNDLVNTLKVREGYVLTGSKCVRES